jgi:hypothetical protein
MDLMFRLLRKVKKNKIKTRLLNFFFFEITNILRIQKKNFELIKQF